MSEMVAKQIQPRAWTPISEETYVLGTTKGYLHFLELVEILGEIV